MKTKARFAAEHPQLNAQQARTAYHMTQIEDWHLYGDILIKNGAILHIDKEGNAL